MIAAVSMRVTQTAEYNEPRDAVSHNWINLLARFGVEPLLIPNIAPVDWAATQTRGARGLLLTNGNDLGAEFGEPSTPGTSPDRDRQERALLEGALAAGAPVFAVCRGLQLVNKLFGGSLIRDLKTDAPGAGSHVSRRHGVRIVDTIGGLLETGEAVVNSFHNQGVVLSGLSPKLKPFALSEGDVVEGLYHPEHALWAVQWHPERPGAPTGLDEILLRHWIERCA